MRSNEKVCFMIHSGHIVDQDIGYHMFIFDITGCSISSSGLLSDLTVKMPKLNILITEAAKQKHL